MKIRPVRGTHDLYGDEIKKFNLIKNIVSQNAELQSFNELQTPIFELSELFSKPLGDQSDVVLKEMYTFKDQGDDLLTLRPEYTTPMIRAAITKNLLNEIPLKVYGFGPMFRRERPQKGRYRQFNQINFEIFGSNDVMSDIEIIVIADDILKSILPGCEIILNLNTLGERDNLKKYKTILSKYFNDNKNKLSEESRNKIESNPLRILDSKNENDIEISNIAPPIQDYISNKSKIQFEELKQGLKFNNIDFVINHKLVRGLDYYSQTVFEFKTKNLGSQDTLLGGGRYDGLINILGGPDIPGVGWAAGIERIAMLMEFKKNTNSKVHIAINNKKFVTHLQTLFKYLKNNQISFYWNYKYNFKKSLSKANQDKVKYIIMMGEKEFESKSYTLRNLYSGNQNEIKLDEIKNYLNDQS